MDLDDKTHIEVIRSKRKTLAIEIRPDMRVVVRAPEKIPQNEIIKFVEEKQNWIKKHLVQMYFKAEENKKQKKEPALTNADVFFPFAEPFHAECRQYGKDRCRQNR